MHILFIYILLFFLLSGQLASSLGVSFNHMQTSLFLWLRNGGVSFNHMQPSLFLWLRNGGWSTMTLLFGHVYLRVHGEFDILDRLCPFFFLFPKPITVPGLLFQTTCTDLSFTVYLSLTFTPLCIIKLHTVVSHTYSYHCIRPLKQNNGMS